MKHAVSVVVVSFFVGCSGAAPPVDATEGEGDVDEGEGEGEGDAVVDVGHGVLRINEVAAAGNPLDWVELTNIGDAPVSLRGLTITDDLTVTDKGALPDVSVDVGAFVVIEIDDDTVGFKLADDEELAVFDGAALIDSVDWDAGDSVAGGSVARHVDGTGDFKAEDQDTRGESNG